MNNPRLASAQQRPRLPTALIIAAVILVLLLAATALALLYLFARTLDARFPLVANTILVALPLGGVALVLLYGWLAAHGLYNRWAGRAAAYADKEIALKRAEVQIAPLATSFSFHDSRSAIEPELLDQGDDESSDPLASALPPPQAGTPRLAQLRQMGHVCRSGNSLLAGYDATGTPQYIELPETGFIGIGGQPRVGKSVTSMLLIEQATLSGWHVFACDPHIQKADGLLSRLRPLSGRLARQAVTPEEIADVVRLVDKIGKRRVNGDPDRTPVIMVIDEFSNLVWRDVLPDDVLAILPSMAAEYAGVGVHGMLIAHDWSKASLGGDLGAALRRTITHRLIHRMDPGNVEFLLPKGSAAQSRAIQGLEKGQALYFGPDGAATVAIPLLGQDDALYAAQGVAPRPYAPRQKLLTAAPAQAAAAPVQPAAPAQPATSSLTPTTRVTPRAALPTDKFPPATVQEEILLLLGGSSAWLTASEIAARLRADIKGVRTELTAMIASGVIVRRDVKVRTTKERFEYASQSINPSINAGRVLSA